MNSIEQTLRLRDYYHSLSIARCIAGYGARSDLCILPIHELLMNAFEHGVMNIGFERKNRLLRQGQWQHELERHFKNPHNADKQIAIHLSHHDQGMALTISDPGAGFDWQHMRQNAADPRQPNGRGLWIARHSPLQDLTFNPYGNQVMCVLSAA